MTKLPWRRSCGAGRQRGLTLVEMTVTLAVAGTLASVALPNLTRLHDKSVINSRVESFGAALRFARAQAIGRGEIVTICALSADAPKGDGPTCTGAGRQWSGGWLVFVDRGDRGDAEAGDQVLLVDAAPARAGGVVGTQRYLSYRANGELLSLAGHFRFIPPGREVVDEPVDGSVLVCVNKPGKARVAKDARCL